MGNTQSNAPYWRNTVTQNVMFNCLIHHKPNLDEENMLIGLFSLRVG